MIKRAVPVLAVFSAIAFVCFVIHGAFSSRRGVNVGMTVIPLPKTDPRR
jgi:hypothetical protein